MGYLKQRLKPSGRYQLHLWSASPSLGLRAKYPDLASDRPLDETLLAYSSCNKSTRGCIYLLDRGKCISLQTPNSFSQPVGRKGTCIIQCLTLSDNHKKPYPDRKKEYQSGLLYRQFFLSGLLYRQFFLSGLLYRQFFLSGLLYRQFFLSGLLYRQCIIGTYLATFRPATYNIVNASFYSHK
jgi:hypothetical protein